VLAPFSFLGEKRIHVHVVFLLATIRPFFPFSCVYRLYMPSSDSVTQQLAAAYTNYADDLYRFTYTRTFSEQDSWDLVQDAFVNLHRYLTSGRIVENYKVFLFQVANNLIIDRARSRKRQNDQEVPLEALREFGIELSSEEEMHSKVQRRLEAGRILQVVRDRCSPADFSIFVMRYINGLMPADIASVTGQTANNISVKLHRMLKEATDTIRGKKSVKNSSLNKSTKINN
jgi:RNA polymerase sigma factor (sigma-70 family)